MNDTVESAIGRSIRGGMNLTERKCNLSGLRQSMIERYPCNVKQHERPLKKKTPAFVVYDDNIYISV